MSPQVLPVHADVVPRVGGLSWEEPQLLVTLPDAPVGLGGHALRPVVLGDDAARRRRGDVACLEHALEHGVGEDHSVALHPEYLHLFSHLEAAVCGGQRHFYIITVAVTYCYTYTLRQ